MAQKRINDLQLRSDFDATCNLPTDDLVQTWRITGAQILAYINSGIDKANIVDLSVLAKTTTYTILNTDKVITADATSAAFTLTLPTAVGITGRVLTIKKIDSTLNQVTIDGSGSETIDGALNKKLSTQYESMKIVSNGTNWIILDRNIPTIVTSYTPTIGAGFGTTSNVAFKYWRNKRFLEIQGSFTPGTVSGVVSSITMPTGLVIDSAALHLANTSANPGPIVGSWGQDWTSAGVIGRMVTATGTSTALIYFANQMVSVAANLTPGLTSSSFGAARTIVMSCSVPIVDWD